MKKFLTIFAVAALALLTVASCKDKEDDETTVDLKAISLSSPSLDMFVGDEATLTVKYTPENATEQPKATWTSSNAEVASVAEGKVTALAAGETTITATVEKLTATCTVKVTAKDDYTGPVEGNSAWSVVGTLLESNWTGGAHGDYVCAEENGAFVLKNVRLAKDDQIKFRKDKDWTENRGINEPDKAAELAVATPAKAVPNGGNIIIPEAGIYDLYYFAEKEAIVYVAKDATLPEIPDFSEPEPEGKIKIDGDFSDWADVEGVSNGTHGMFKFTADDNYVYFYSHRTTEGRYSEIWGGAGYVYFAFDLDKDMTTGETLWGNGPYEFVGVIYPYAGTADAPAFNETPGDACLPESSTLANAICNGVVDAEGAKIEVRVPRADLPALTEKFMVYSWGNKDLSKVEYPYPYEAPEPQVEWDYTPSAEYTADNNLWKAVDAAHTVSWYYNPVWGDPIEGPEVKFTQSTYEFWNKTACTGGDWTAQMWIEPTSELLLDASKKYNFSCKVYATSETPVFMKFYHKGEDGSRSFEVARQRIPAGQITEIKAEDFTPIISSQCLLIDFGGIPANTKVFIKDIVLTEGDAVTPPQPMDWDYTPGAAFTADNNLWKVADGNEMYYYYHCTSADWNGQDTIAAEVPFMTKTQSTYELTYEEATANPWQNQFFIFPGEGHFVALEADKTYKISFTLAANADMYAFANFKTYDANNAKREGSTIHEWGAMNLKATEPVVIEHEFTGVEAENVTLIFDFGGNPAGAKVFIKDITIAAPETVLSVSEFIALEDNTEAKFTGIVAAVGNNGSVITDGQKNIYVYKPATTPAIGDKVTVKATKTTYYGLIETKQGGELTVVSSGNKVPQTTLVDITANFDDYPNNAPTSDYIQVKGTVAISGNYSNLNVAGAEARQGSLQGLSVKEYDGKVVVLKGYYVGTSGTGGKFVTLVVTDVTPVATDGSTGEDLDDPVDTNPWE